MITEQVDDLTPFDQHDAGELGQLAKGEVGHLGGPFQAVQIGVMQRDLAGPWSTVDRIAVHQGERRRRDPVGDAERHAEPLGERGLAGTHLAREHDDVAGAGQLGDHRGDRMRVGDRTGVQRNGVLGHQSSMLRRGTRGMRFDTPHTIS